MFVEEGDIRSKVLIDNELIYIREYDEIVIATFRTTNIDLDTAEKLVRYRVEATGGEDCLTIANIKVVKNISKEARDFFASERGCEGIIATALVIDSPLGRMIGNFYMTINKPLRPVRLFTDEEKAKKWLNKLK